MRSNRVIRVAPEDDIVFILNKVQEYPGEALCLALSAKCTQFRNDVNLRLLNAYAQEAEVIVALSTDDEQTIARAAEHGIPTYRKPDQAFHEEARLPVPETDSAPRVEAEPVAVAATPASSAPSRWMRTLAVVMVALLATFGTAYALLPKVQIDVEPTLLMHPVLLRLDLAGRVKSHSLEVQTEVEVPATGEARSGEVPAQGIATFFNNNEDAITVPAGTELRTADGRSFRTLEDVEVPGLRREMRLGVVVHSSAGQADVRIEAVEAGSAGNVPIGAIQTVVGGGAGLQVRNPEPLSGGVDRLWSVVVASDLERGRALAIGALEEEWARVRADFEAEAAGSEILAVEAPQSPIIAIQAAEGEPTDSFLVTAEGAGAIEAIERAELERAALEQLDGALPPGYARYAALGLEFQLHRYNKEEQALELEVFVPVVAQFDTVTLAREVAGRPAAEAAAYPEGIEGIRAARIHGEVHELPAWAPWIEVHVVAPAAIEGVH